ncbi:MAG: cation-transporting P-type ATPase, partial [Pseudolabrys sp.]
MEQLWPCHDERTRCRCISARGSLSDYACRRRPPTEKNGLSSAEAAHRLAQSGPNTIADRTESKWHKLVAYFWGPLPFLIEAAAII